MKKFTIMKPAYLFTDVYAETKDEAIKMAKNIATYEWDIGEDGGDEDYSITEETE